MGVRLSNLAFLPFGGANSDSSISGKTLLKSGGVQLTTLEAKALAAKIAGNLDLKLEPDYQKMTKVLATQSPANPLVTLLKGPTGLMARVVELGPRKFSVKQGENKLETLSNKEDAVNWAKAHIVGVPFYSIPDILTYARKRK